MKSAPYIFFFLCLHLVWAQHQEGVDFLHASVSIAPKPEEQKIEGLIRYTFEVLQDVDSIFLDAHNMKFISVLLDGKEYSYQNTSEALILSGPFNAGQTHVVQLEYEAHPNQTVYFLGWEDAVEGNEQIWTQGQGKYTSHWLPSLDAMTDKIEFDLSITFQKDYEVVANGILKEKKGDSSTTTWHFDMEKPMSSYLVAFAIGNFDKEIFKTTSGIPVELYFEPKDSLRVEPTYRYTQQIFDFLEKEIGMPYPWQNYKQVPVQDFLYAGMENTTATLFSNTFLVDSIAFLDKNYVNVNAHELAHQWFGNLVTEKSGSHHWLHEGFATYYAYLAEQEIFGDEYFYWHLLETAEALHNFSQDGQGESLTNPNAGSLTFYEKGAWALVMLKERVGDENFKKGVKNYLEKYAFTNVTIDQFMDEMETASGLNLSDFEKQWLDDSEFPLDEVHSFLSEKSSSIDTYFKIGKEISSNPDATDSLLQKQWDELESDDLKQRLVKDFSQKLSENFLIHLLNEESVKVRQAVILSLQEIPEKLQIPAESLLSDPSYVTVEAALYRLWADFPEHRERYLDSTEGIEGMPNKNIRLLWLTLALITPDYNFSEKQNYFKELNGYTNSKHHFEVRLLAFQYLKNLGAFSDEALKNLIEACQHHVWHFKKTSRNILKDVLKDEKNRARVEKIYQSLSAEQQDYLDKTLGR